MHSIPRRTVRPSLSPAKNLLQVADAGLLSCIRSLPAGSSRVPVSSAPNSIGNGLLTGTCPIRFVLPSLVALSSLYEKAWEVCVL